MSYDLERRLIEQAYKDEMPDDAAIQYGNTPYQPPASGFTRITVLGGGGSRMLSVGVDTQRRYAGVVDVAIFVPVDVGTAGLRAVALQVEAALAHRSIYERSNRLTLFGSDFTPIGKAGDWYQGNVSIRFERDGVTEATSLRSFAGRRLFTFSGQRLGAFASNP